MRSVPTLGFPQESGGKRCIVVNPIPKLPTAVLRRIRSGAKAGTDGARLLYPPRVRGKSRKLCLMYFADQT
jgi:hypothetical protein